MTKLNICFYFEDNDLMIGMWDHLVRGYDIENAYVILEDGVDPKSVSLGNWKLTSSIDSIKGDKIFFSPKGSPNIDDGIDVSEILFPEDVTLCFGSDNKHNTLDTDVPVSYIALKRKKTLYAVQAAHIAIWNWCKQHGNF